MQLINLKIYEPTQKLSADALYLIDENGLDWYESQSKFSDDTLKIACDDQGVIRSSSFDVSMLWPESLSVFEVDKNNIPQDLSLDGSWQFTNGMIIPRKYSAEELIAKAEDKKARLISVANAYISLLERAVRYNMATDDERKELEEWEVYSVLLSRVNTSEISSVEWPNPPM